MTILIDIDDTVWDLLTPWVTELNRLYKTNVNISDIKEWDLSKAFSMLSSDQIRYPLLQKYFWDLVHPYTDAIIYINKLVEDGHDIYFVTSTHYKNIEYKISKLEGLFSFNFYDKFIVAKNKHMIMGDILIDDYINNLDKNRRYNILFGNVYNKDKDYSEYNWIIRCTNWKEVYDFIEKIS